MPPALRPFILALLFLAGVSPAFARTGLQSSSADATEPARLLLWNRHVADLREALAVRGELRRWPVLLRGIGFSLAATLGLGLALWIVSLARRRLIARDPAPFVLQRALSDFYVEYQLMARLASGADRAQALTQLHAAIQDAFNEHGVQILSPHFEIQPAKPVVVPREAWHAPPAKPPSAT